MSNLNELKPITSLNSFARFCCTIGNLPSSYMVSLTYEEQLLWFCDYLQNTVIPAVNNNAEVVKELQELYVKLKNYVDNYFENLDVQNEINQKLDKMAQDGTLQEIITSYLKINGILSFNNINDLKTSENLVNGSFVKTYGFYELNDLGGAFYKIREINNKDIVNEINIISLNNENLIAELILNDEMNILQFGINENNSNRINEFINLLENKTLLFNNVDYKLNQDLILPSNIKLIGNNTTISSDDDIILNDNNIIDNIIFNTITPITRNDKGYITNQISCHLYANQKNNIIIKNCNGNGLFIELLTCNNCIIDNCVINAGFSNAGTITIINNCLNCKVLNSEIYGANYDAISIYRSNDIKVDNCLMHNNGHSGTWTPYSKNLLISNCKSYNNGIDGFDMNFRW